MQRTAWRRRRQVAIMAPQRRHRVSALDGASAVGAALACSRRRRTITPKRSRRAPNGSGVSIGRCQMTPPSGSTCASAPSSGRSRRSRSQSRRAIAAYPSSDSRRRDPCKAPAARCVKRENGASLSGRPSLSTHVPLAAKDSYALGPCEKRVSDLYLSSRLYALPQRQSSRSSTPGPLDGAGLCGGQTWGPMVFGAAEISCPLRACQREGSAGLCPR